MYSPEEKAQIRQLEDMGCKTRFETNIKEVDGGYIIQHRTSYVLDDEVKGVTQEQYVASDTYRVCQHINYLYADTPVPTVQGPRPPQAIGSALPEPERYAAHTNQPGG